MACIPKKVYLSRAQPAFAASTQIKENITSKTLPVKKEAPMVSPLTSPAKG